MFRFLLQTNCGRCDVFGLFRSMSILLLAVTALGLSGRHVYAQAETTGFVTTYPVTGAPLNIVVEKPGQVWFTLPQENAIGTVVVQGADEYTFTRYEVPTANAEPYSLVYRDGVIWFTEHAGNKIGRFDIAQLEFREFAIPTAASGPTGIDIAPDGRIWFLESAARKLAVFDPVTEEFIEYFVPFYIVESRLESIRIDTAKGPWFTMPDANRLAFYDIARDRFDAWNTVSFTGAFTLPTGLTVDSRGTPWLTAKGSDVVGRYTPETLASFRWIGTPTSNSEPANLVFDDLGPNWSLFFTESGAGKVARFLIRPSDTALMGVSEVSINAANSAPWGIDVDDDHAAWIADPGADLIAVWRSPYEDGPYLYLPTLRGQ